MIAQRTDTVYAQHVNLCYTDVMVVRRMQMIRLAKASQREEVLMQCVL